MEKRLTRDELLNSFLRKAENPFTTMEQKNDIRRILMESNTMRGMNHLFLVKCYFDEEQPLFHISKKEAIRQAKLAYRENNRGAFYYLYLLLKDSDPVKARNYLNLACACGNPKAYLEKGRLQHRGILFEKNEKEAFKNYHIAALCSLADGYYGMLLLASELGDITLARQVYEEANKNGISLPGVVE
ncbi:MAG: hypothetical protein K5762_03970 [Bacilli bacterium]|jgi:TPR repeat protein|nr:hypothetical protein [Bacilli bacterium]